MSEFVKVTLLKESELPTYISEMDRATREWTDQAARGECGWCCSDCCYTWPDGMPDKCEHGNQWCTDIIKRDKLRAMSVGNEAMTNKTELLSCPFCSSKEVKISQDGGSDERCGYNFTYVASCNGCNARVMVGSGHDKNGWCNEGASSVKDRCIEHWNTRAAPPQPGHSAQPMQTVAGSTCRLLEAHRLGEFRLEGGSETVEAMSLDSFDESASAGHDYDLESYTAGWATAVYEQVGPLLTQPLYTHTDAGEVDRLKAGNAALQQRLNVADQRIDELVGAIRSVNKGKAHEVMVPGDDEPQYRQRKEWVDWILQLCEQPSKQ